MKKFLAGAAVLLLLGGGAVRAEDVTLTYYVDDNPTNVATANGLIAEFQKENPGVKIELETHPGGGEGDNLVKTRLATGEMSDIFRYNAGSLFRALNPPQNMLDLTSEPFVGNVSDTFKPVVSVDNHIYGVPEEAAMGGGVLYNKKIYADLGLSVRSRGQNSRPTTRRSRLPGRCRSSRPSARPGRRSFSCWRITSTFRLRSRISPTATPRTRRSTRPVRRP